MRLCWLGIEPIESCLQCFAGMQEPLIPPVNIFLKHQSMKNPRGPITSALKSAWESTIAKYYNIDGSSSAIGSEAGLQAYLMVELDAAIRVLEKGGLMALNTRIFIEANIGSTDIRPDLIICRHKSVVAVVELKYTPRLDLAACEDSASFGVKKDLSSFTKLYELTQAGARPEFLHKRYLGKFEQPFENFIFSKNTLFVWAGVHKSSKHSLKSTLGPEHVLSKMPVFEMHANTEASQKATTSYFFESEALGVVAQ